MIMAIQLILQRMFTIQVSHSGNGKIVLNGTQIQTIDGNGVFGNLELNNTNAAAAPVSLICKLYS